LWFFQSYKDRKIFNSQRSRKVLIYGNTGVQSIPALTNAADASLYQGTRRAEPT
jgi:hypothetical protein